MTNSPNDPDSPTQLDVMRQMVKNKEMMADMSFDKRCSIESEMSDASTLISVSSENIGEEEYRRRKRINHHSIRGTLSDSEMEMSGVGTLVVWQSKILRFDGKNSVSLIFIDFNADLIFYVPYVIDAHVYR